MAMRKEKAKECDTLSTHVTSNRKAFCEVCSHVVLNMGKHIQTDEHTRSVSKAKGGESMAKAFILIETVVGRNKVVVTALKQIEGMKSVDTVTGPYDIIALVAGETLNDIGDLISDKIIPIAGISRTVTCLAVDGIERR